MKHVMRVLAFSLAFFFLTTIFSNPAGAQESDAVGGSLARCDAVFSGRIGYSVVKGKSLDAETPEPYTLTFSGSSWKRESARDASTIPRYFDKAVLATGFDPKTATPLEGLTEEVFISHRGLTIDYQSHPQDDRSIRRTGRITEGEQSMDDQTTPFPQFLGSYSYASTKKFVADNKSKALYKGMERIEGQDTFVYEWVVSAEERHAFFSFNAVNRDGGILRLYIAPALGYVIPRIEQAGKSGKLAKVIEAGDFVRCNGMYLPRRARIQCFNFDGPSFAWAYKLDRIEKINEPFSDDEFTLRIPPGTEMADARDGKNSYMFEITDKDTSIPPDLGDAIQVERPGMRWLGWRAAVAVGAVLGAVLLLAYTFLRRMRARRQPA